MSQLNNKLNAAADSVLHVIRGRGLLFLHGVQICGDHESDFAGHGVLEHADVETDGLFELLKPVNQGVPMQEKLARGFGNGQVVLVKSIDQPPRLVIDFRDIPLENLPQEQAAGVFRQLVDQPTDAQFRVRKNILVIIEDIADSKRKSGFLISFRRFNQSRGLRSVSDTDTGHRLCIEHVDHDAGNGLGVRFFVPLVKKLDKGENALIHREQEIAGAGEKKVFQHMIDILAVRTFRFNQEDDSLSFHRNMEPGRAQPAVVFGKLACQKLANKIRPAVLLPVRFGDQRDAADDFLNIFRLVRFDPELDSGNPIKFIQGLSERFFFRHRRASFTVIVIAGFVIITFLSGISCRSAHIKSGFLSVYYDHRNNTNLLFFQEEIIMASLSLEHIGKEYPNGFKAVKDFNLEVADKEFIIFVGPSGCGKSTTLRMIAGLEDISEGTLKIDDKVMNDVEPKDRDIAMVFQNYALYPHMTVFDNMAFGLKLRKVPKDQIKQQVEEAAKILDLDKLLDRKPKALSGGQRQRVAMGRAIVRNPKVFLMDEPLSNLDAKLRVQMRTEISKLHQRLGATIIYVTHDQTEAMTLGTRIVVMKDGVIQQIDTPQALYDHPCNQFVAGFIGSPQMNFMDAEVHVKGKEVTLSVGGSALTVPPSKADRIIEGGYDGKTIVMGIRPEDIHDEEVFLNQYADAVISTEIRVFELLGSEVLLYFDFAGDQMTARVNPRTTARAGSSVKLAFNMEKSHYFDKETEEVISD